MLEVKDMCFSYGKNKIIDGISLTAEKGEVVAIIGSNGTGKSTFLKCIAGILKGHGQVHIHGEDLLKLSRIEKSKKISYLSQFNYLDSDLTVFEVVLLGRINHLGIKVTDRDIEKVWEVLDSLEISHLANRNIMHLSGGQRQIAFIGQALVKEPEVLLLDEPTNNLDMLYTYKILKSIKQLTKEKELITLIILHDVNLVESMANQVVVLHEKQVYARGKVAEVFTEEMFRDVYSMKVDFFKNEEGESVVVPRSAY